MMKQNWIYKKLGDVATIKSGKSIGANQIFNFDTSMYPCYGGNGLRGYVQTYNNEGDMPIIGRVGALCGNVHLSHGKFYATEHALVVKILSNNILAEWLTYCLKSLNLRRIAKGVAQPVIAASEVANISIPVPPLPLQQSIVAELDNINNLINIKKAQLKDLDNLAQSIFYEMFGDPIENEKGWESVYMEDVCQDIVDCPHSTPKKVSYITNYPCIRTSELKNGVINWNSMQYLDADEYKKRTARLAPIPGDIVFGREGTIGDAVVLPKGYNFCLGQRTMLLRAKSGIISNVFLHRTILSEWIKQQIEYVNVSSTVAHINIKDFKKFSIPLPPLPLQQKFAEKIEAIEKHKQIVNVTIKDLETLLASRMQFWFE